MGGKGVVGGIQRSGESKVTPERSWDTTPISDLKDAVVAEVGSGGWGGIVTQLSPWQ